MTNVLMVTTTKGMLNGVHGHTSDRGPAISLGPELVVGATGLQHGLVQTTSSSGDTDGTSAGRLQDLLGTRRKTNTSGSVLVVGNDGDIVTRGTGNFATISRGLLDVEANGTFSHLSQGHHVSNLHLRVLTAVDELSGVSTFGGDEVLLHEAVFVRVTEGDDGERGATGRVMNDLLDDTLCAGEREANEEREGAIEYTEKKKDSVDTARQKKREMQRGIHDDPRHSQPSSERNKEIKKKTQKEKKRQTLT